MWILIPFIILLILSIVGFVVFLVQALKSRNQKNTSNYDDDVNWKMIGKLTGFISGGVAILLVFFASILIVDSGEVEVKKLFGTVQEDVFSEGLHFVNPFGNYFSVNIQRQSIVVDDGDNKPGMLCPTSDGIQTTVEANFAFEINPDYASWIIRAIGSEEKLVKTLMDPASRSATRDGSAAYSLEAMQTKERSGYETALTSQFEKNVIASLPRNRGLNEGELGNVIIILPVQLMGIVPDEKVANSLSEKKAAEIDLARQPILTAIAEEQGKRMKNQGIGVKSMFTELPKDYNTAEMTAVIGALADLKRAEAMMKAVESGKVSSTIFEGSSVRVSR